MESNPLKAVIHGLLSELNMALNMFWKRIVQVIIHCFVCYGLLAGVAYSQSAQAQPSSNDRRTEIDDAVAKVKSGRFNGYHVGVIGEAHAIEAIPDLEKQFTVASDIVRKAKIAQVLLSLGDRKDIYWNYLAELVKPALESDIPSPIQYDDTGKSVPGLSHDFVTWAQIHGLVPDEVGENAIYVLPGIVMLVGASHDQRAVPLLRRALLSPNPMIQIAASKGLAEMQDVTSVPLIVAKCKEVPAEEAEAIAESLVYFDAPEAQSMVDALVPKELAAGLRQRRMAGSGPLHGK